MDVEQKSPASETSSQPLTHVGVESALNRALAVGVIVSAAIAATGALLYLRVHGHDPALSSYDAPPERLRSVHAIVIDAAHLEPGAVIQLGVLVLILTPVARVAFSLVLFLLRKDAMYVVITLTVLAVLIAGLLGLG